MFQGINVYRLSIIKKGVLYFFECGEGKRFMHQKYLLIFWQN
jgi:hypothetical protein